MTFSPLQIYRIYANFQKVKHHTFEIGANNSMKTDSDEDFMIACAPAIAIWWFFFCLHILFYNACFAFIYCFFPPFSLRYYLAVHFYSRHLWHIDKLRVYSTFWKCQYNYRIISILCDDECKQINKSAGKAERIRTNVDENGQNQWQLTATDNRIYLIR